MQKEEDWVQTKMETAVSRWYKLYISTYIRRRGCAVGVLVIVQHRSTTVSTHQNTVANNSSQHSHEDYI